jgi:tetratricopeptide (TPR) repeat protein
MSTENDVSTTSAPTEETVTLTPEEQRALEFIEKAEKILHKSALKSLFNKKTEDPADLYQQAANQYKMVKKYEEAANCFLKVAILTEKEKIPTKTAMAYVNASNAFRVAKDYESNFIKFKFKKLNLV